MKRFLYTLLLLGLVLPAGRSATAQTAKDALTASGFKGGLIVHLGCGDAERTLQLRTGDNCIIQGLDTSAEKVGAARARIAAAGLYGEVTARPFDGKTLPFADNTVNLLVVDDPCSVPREEMMRILCPRAAVCIKEGNQWKAETRPWPADLDEWTHYQHDPQGTMVGKDKVVGPPQRIQWVGDPKWLRNHDFMSSMYALVSSGGRLFYIIDEGLRAHVFLPPQWTLIARDGFNGAILWQRPVKDWHPSNWPLKSGPGYLPRRIVAVGDRVFVTLGLIEPVTAIDAVTGRTVRTYGGTKATEEILCSDGVLYLLVDPAKQPVNYKAETPTYGEINRANSGWGWSTERPERTLMAVEADSGKVLWKHTAKVAPLTLTVGGQRVFYCDGAKMAALDRKTGKPAWASEDVPRLAIRPATGAAPRVVYSDGVVVLCHSTQTSGFSADDGKLLWQGKTLPSGHHCPNDLFLIDNLIWSAHTGAAQQKGTHLTALDLRTGETRKDLVAENLPGFPMHPRCYPSRATERYIMTAGMGTEFYVPGDSKMDIYNYVRGSCVYGVMPCNGLLYKPPDSCACYYMSKLEYFCALAPARKAPAAAAAPIPDGQRREEGPAYAAGGGGKAAAPAPAAEDWPMYRHDAARSGFCPSPVPAGLKKAWEAALGGRLTQPVIAGGKVYVASVDAHTLYALDGGSGKVLWNYVAGGRIDSPPTIHQGAVIFGSADGRVYCLRAADGALAWTYLVAPQDRQILSCQRPESTWPVSGSVLVYNNVVYALAGRNLFFDGGMRLARLDAATGRKLSETVLNELDPQTGKNLQTLIVGKSMPVANPDILSCDGKYVYMGAQRFDLEGKRVEIASLSSKSAAPPADAVHLFCSTGFLDDLWFHRSYWTYGPNFPEGWSEYNIAQKRAPSGRIMVLDDARAYAFRADGLGNTLLPTPMYRLYAADKKVRTGGAPPSAGPLGAKGKKGITDAKDAGKTPKAAGKAAPDAIAGGFQVYWQIPSPPLLANAMALGGKNLFVAGPPDVADETKMLGFLPGADDDINRQLKAQDDAWRGKMGALLWVVSADTGEKLAEYKLDALPVWDGMSAAGGKLFVSLKNGTVVCWDGK
ncbi:MAG: PQQ-binding-like beta-propeller repeat protein [Planctomycetes bacterium]|nr:PQQ-binding-like beta-propeller repeat protein [Planctomycetota bacterium]